MKKPANEKKLKKKAGILLSTILDLAKGMIVNGADTWQVEEAINELFDTYCFMTSNLMVMSNCIYASVQTWDGRTYTEVRRINGSDRNLDKLDQLFSLVREVNEKPIGMDRLAERVHEILDAPGNCAWMSILAGGVAAGSFTLFFNGGLIDAVGAAFVAAVVINICKYATSRQKNKLTPNTFAAFAMEAMIILLAWLGLCRNPDSITLGGTMLLISSLGVTNGFKDLLHGDALSGLMDTANALIGALGIAVGIMIAIFLFLGSDYSQTEITTLSAAPALQVAYCVLACSGFSVVFGARRRAIVYASVGGGITYTVYLLAYRISGSVFDATFAGAVFVAVYAYAICRFTHIPETVMLTICVVPLLPGSNLYYTALGAVTQNPDMFISQGKMLIVICIGISVGFIFVDAIHIYTSMFRRLIMEKLLRHPKR